VACAGLVVAGFSFGGRRPHVLGSYKIDGLSQFFKFAVALGFAVAVLIASSQPTLDPEKRADYFCCCP